MVKPETGVVKPEIVSPPCGRIQFHRLAKKMTPESGYRMENGVVMLERGVKF
jgi:hypothetical protein